MTISIIKQIEELQQQQKVFPVNTDSIRNIKYRLERIENFLNEEFQFNITRKTPKHYISRNKN